MSVCHHMTPQLPHVNRDGASSRVLAAPLSLSLSRPSYTGNIHTDTVPSYQVQKNHHSLSHLHLSNTIASSLTAPICVCVHSSFPPHCTQPSCASDRVRLSRLDRLVPLPTFHHLIMALLLRLRPLASTRAATLASGRLSKHRRIM